MTNPFIFVAIAFLGTIANRLYSKSVLFRLDGYALAILTNLVSAMIVLPILLYFSTPLSLISVTDWFFIILLGVLWTYVAWAGNLSIAQNNFSFKEIIRQTRVIWVVLAGIFILGETLLFKDYIGIALIIGSVFVVSYKTISFKEHVSSKPILLAWSVAFTLAAIAVFEKNIVSSVDVLVYAFLMYIFPTLFMSFFLNKKRLNDTYILYKNHKKEIVICSLLMIVSYLGFLLSIKYLPISIAYPIIQSSTVIGVLIGTFIFEDNKDWQKKLFASTLAVLGVIIIKLM